MTQTGARFDSGTSIQAWVGDTPLFQPGDPLDSVHPRGIVVLVTRDALTYRPRRWYDGPRLALRAIWRRVLAQEVRHG